MAVRVVRLIKKQLKPNEKQDFWYLKWSLYKELNQILIRLLFHTLNSLNS